MKKEKNLKTRLNSVWKCLFFLIILINTGQICYYLLILLSTGTITNQWEGTVYQCSNRRDLLYRQAVRRFLGMLPTGTRKSTGKMSLISCPRGPSDILALCSECSSHVSSLTHQLLDRRAHKCFPGREKRGYFALPLVFRIFHWGNVR